MGENGNSDKFYILGLQKSFPDSSADKEPACNAGDTSSIPGQKDALEKG